MWPRTAAAAMTRSSTTACVRTATLRKLEVIGQAVKNLSEHTKSRVPEIPWKRIAGMRDKVSHDYFGVNLEIVWGVVQKELPKLRVAGCFRSLGTTLIVTGK